jgi:hypothetical protein
MRLLRRAAWLATITTLLGATAAWWRSHHRRRRRRPRPGLTDGSGSPTCLQAPAMDMYMYPFGNPGRPSC